VQEKLETFKPIFKELSYSENEPSFADMFLSKKENFLVEKNESGL
jgi:hypothetical protein